MTVRAAAASSASHESDGTISAQLARWLCQTRAHGVPEELRQTAAWLVLDWLGCAIAGLNTAPGRILLQHTREQPAGLASCVGLTEGRSAQAAALHNGGVSHIIEMDDVDRASVIHPGAVVIPAALAVGEQVGSSGRELLGAIALGYEIAIRVGESVGKAHYFYWHNTSTCGGFGAAAAAGALLHLREAQVVWALGSAGTQAGGLWEFIADGAMSKHLHTGRAASSGVLAADLAALGFTGAKRIFEGRQGFFAATSPDGDPSLVTSGLGKIWKLPGVSIKPFPSCRHTHSAIEAALRLRSNHALVADDVERIQIDAYQSALDLTDNAAPSHPYAAKFSVQYCVARALIDGAVTLDDFADDRIVEPAARSLMSRIDVRLDPHLDTCYPRQFPARVSLTLRGGRRVFEQVDNPKGDPEAPLSPEELAAKFRSLVAGTAYEARADELVETIVGLDRRRSVRGLLAE